MTNPDPSGPGVFHGLRFQDYLRLPGLSRTEIYTLYHWSPAHARAKREQMTETDAMRFGTLVHLAALEPEEFMALVYPYEKLDGRTKEGKAQRLSVLEKEAEGIYCVEIPTLDKIRKVRESIRRHPVASWLVDTDQREVAIQWMDADHDVLCKARLDFITRRGERIFIGDIKTCRDARRSAFSRAIHNYGYHFQAAYYLDGFRSVTGTDAAFIFLPIEKDLCFACATYQIDEDALAYGRTEYKRAIGLAKKYQGVAELPAYQQSEEELMIGLPKWAGDEPPSPFAIGEEE